MKKELAPLLAGAMTLSILLSACATQAEAPSPASTDMPSLSAAIETASTPEPEPSVEVSGPSQEPTEEPEPSQAVESAAIISDAPQAGTQTPAPAVSAPQQVVSTPAPAVSAGPQPAAEPDPEPTPTPASPVAAKEAAMSYIGQSVSSLIAAIGQPNGRNYAPSCMGDGEDGELFYNGFTVYTYREGGVETVEDVM